MRSTTLLNEQGDVTLVWTEDQDEEMEAVIEKKMAEGVAFFIVEPRFFGLLPPKRIEITEASMARKHRAIAVRDADFARLFEAGKIEAVPTGDAPLKGSRKAKSAKEAAQSQTVAVKSRRGG